MKPIITIKISLKLWMDASSKLFLKMLNSYIYGSVMFWWEYDVMFGEME